MLITYNVTHSKNYHSSITNILQIYHKLLQINNNVPQRTTNILQMYYKLIQKCETV